jgi:hypothetical protein
MIGSGAMPTGRAWLGFQDRRRHADACLKHPFMTLAPALEPRHAGPGRMPLLERLHDLSIPVPFSPP